MSFLTRNVNLRRAAVAIMIAVATAFAFVLSAAPAQAHHGKIDAQVAHDGLGGVYVTFIYIEDGHPVDALLTATVEGRSSSGEVVEPIALSSASQGVGIWETPAGSFPAGQWEITVRITDPVAFEKSMPIEISVADVVEDDHDEPAASDALSAPTASATTPGDPGMGVWLGVGIGAVVATAIVVAVRMSRKRTPASAQ
ncbi:hypothetical protein [Microbacterium sp. SLBN-146]|uniref:hypothetical protein n=1 Tax=Microbacterium sp. SLBN-146 TaxID=2768457 RepID=UPI0011518E75|nr:hypothetical protein [Microbacterium sp. SLBN-146]TQJ30705.1 hypothetical protein FBY39_1162 [Microbacterium sp. SLBN-146]